MKTNWPRKKIGEVVQLQYGKGISKFDRKFDGMYPIFGANGVLGQTDKYLVEGEAVIIGRKGSAGEVTRVSGKFWPSDVTYYILGNKEIDIDYLFHLLKSLNLQRFAVGVKPGINRNRIYELEIPLPPLAEQKKIVGKLEKMLSKIKETKKLRAEALESTQNLLPSELHKIFSQGKEKGWEEKELGNICTINMGQSPPSSTYNNNQNGLPFYQGKKDYGEKYPKPRVWCSKPIKIVEDGDILISVRAPVGALNIADERSSIGRGLAGLRAQKELDQDFLFYFLILEKQNISNLGTGSTFTAISKKHLENYKIPLPPLNEQKKIVAHLDSLSEKVKELEKLQLETAADLDTLSQSILHQAFEGEL